jgi:adenine-specific DNA-methyltransferase
MPSPMDLEPVLLNMDTRDAAHAGLVPEGIACVLTDPPYGVNYRSRRAVTPEGLEYVEDIANDAELESAVALFHEVMDCILPNCNDEAELYVFTRWDIVDRWIQAIRDLGPSHAFVYKMMLVWDKGVPGMGDIEANWGCGHELILYAKRGRLDLPYRRSSIIAVEKVHPKEAIHPTQKPVPLLEKYIEMSTKPGDLVVDPFAGSASTLVAAERLGRRSWGCEMHKPFFERSTERLTQTSMF